MNTKSRLIIAGSRGLLVASDEISQFLKSNGITDVLEVVSGGAQGIDICGERWAKAHGIPVRKFLPRWKLYGKLAGHVRNTEMAEYADVLLLIWDGVSRGSLDMKKTMIHLNKPIIEIVVKPPIVSK